MRSGFMNQKTVVFGLIGAMLIGLSIFASLDYLRGSDRKPEIKSVSLRLAWVYDMAEAGVFVAQDKGYFDEEGLRLTVHPGGFGLDPIKQVATGANDFGVAGAGNVLLARAEGIPVVAIGAEFQNTPVGFIVQKDSGITSFADFKGRRVGVQTGADTDVLYRALLVRNDMTSRDVIEIPIQYDVLPFTSGRIDVLPGYVTNQPIILRSHGIDVEVISAASEGLKYYGNVYITSETMIRENPDEVKAFVAAVRNGWLTAFADKPATIEAVRSRTQDFDPSDLSTIYDSVMPFIRAESDMALLKMSEERWRTTRNVLVDAGLLEPGIDISKAYTNEFIR